MLRDAYAYKTLLAEIALNHQMYQIFHFGIYT